MENLNADVRFWNIFETFLIIHIKFTITATFPLMSKHLQHHIYHLIFIQNKSKASKIKFTHIQACYHHHATSLFMLSLSLFCVLWSNDININTIKFTLKQMQTLLIDFPNLLFIILFVTSLYHFSVTKHICGAKRC